MATDWTGVVVPAGNEVPSTATFQNLSNSLQGRIVYQATSLADCQTKYASAPLGSICSISSNSSVLTKTNVANNTWVSISADTGWLSLSSTFVNSNWTDTSSAYRILNNVCYAHVVVVYTPGFDMNVWANGQLWNSGNTVLQNPLNVLQFPINPPYAANGIGHFGQPTSGYIAAEINMSSAGLVSVGTILSANGHGSYVNSTASAPAQWQGSIPNGTSLIFSFQFPVN